MKKDAWFYLVAAASGVLTWVLVSVISGRVEAWDSGLYFSVGMPVVCIVALVLGFLEPRRAWRWGVVPLLAQFLWMLLTQGPGNLLPLGIVVFVVLSLPSIVAARIGAFVAVRRARSDEA
ncbi:hypothetical protein SCL_0449 [Sulfuricaulis limicola]|uniref:Uncharacterized protein n=1 Tax=Sulfuricaulis limicola TaxID=1620215 RepID=A0A1B4XD96_9GAMM|nr:hypothetical protein [Sulfuricaulis limicola]BAV32771.1 hypothetical protein SCL_0449 [Sulfuricaulis limicola]